MLKGLAHKVDQGPGPEDRAGPHGRQTVRWLLVGLSALLLLLVTRQLRPWTAPTPGSGQEGDALGRTAALAATTAGSGAPAAPTVAGADGRAYERALAAELEGLLSQIEGAGRVRISVSFARGPSYVFGHNTTSDTRSTEERDASGVLRTVSESATTAQPVIMQDGQQGERALVTEEQRPTVAGVLILAEGARDSLVRLQLVRAIQALFMLPAHRITVLPMGR
jgi:stage III sporulation protein AG